MTNQEDAHSSVLREFELISDANITVDVVRKVLEKLSLRNLSGRILDKSEFVITPGGYGDVYIGFVLSTELGYADAPEKVKVAIKRSRIPLMSNPSSAKVKFFFL